MATAVINQNNYKSCPLKKRPIVFIEEESEIAEQQNVIDLVKPTSEDTDIPQDLSLKRKASQDFEDYSLPEKRDCVLNLSTSVRSRSEEGTNALLEKEKFTTSMFPKSSSGPALLSPPNLEYDRLLDYSYGGTAIHLRGLTPATSGYTTNVYQSAFASAAGCAPMTTLWPNQLGFNNNLMSIYPSPASSITSAAASPLSAYSSGCNNIHMMTPPSSPGSEASESSEPEDLSVRSDIPLPALFHLFDEAPTTAPSAPIATSSSSSRFGSSTYGSSSSLSSLQPSRGSLSSCGGNVAKNYRFKCDKCNKMYSTSIGLSKHKQFHCPAAECNQEKKQHACEDCGKLYTTIGALKMHIRTHTLPCKCPICGKAFSRPWLLQGHIRTHTGEKPFQCPDCPRSFADRSNLRAHQQTHFDIKKYACTVCGKSFSRMSLLNKHASSSCKTSFV